MSLHYILPDDYFKHLFLDAAVMQIPAANTEITAHDNTDAASPVFGAPVIWEVFAPLPEISAPLPEVLVPFPEPVLFPATPFAAASLAEPDALDLSNIFSSVSIEA